MAAYVIRTIPSSTRQTMYYNGCGAPEWQRGFPEIFGSKERADKKLLDLKKKWKDIEVARLDENKNPNHTGKQLC